MGDHQLVVNHHTFSRSHVCPEKNGWKMVDKHSYVTPKVRRTEVHDNRYEAVRPNRL